ncbi:transcription factor NIGTH1 [Brachypodium distachyon]|uniref:Uncharacterized protein n=1 Tax=Brachypodium distachyon TaxID=15368 RepID=I1I0T6_BRADI|nr:transcription factor NIGTH1 [Brachypodium distachyon]KQJ95008.1 hypothetical protein BRADI_3g14630v3 [Brachypodium distachyon]|eukprot:XP_003573358.1 transcription factor NIGTH1 [Brachypodium distachyon]
MRLLSFVPCGCRAGPIDDAPPASSSDHHHHVVSTISPAARRIRRRRARSLGGSPQWRPALGDIYEESFSASARSGATGAAGTGKSGGGRVVPSGAGRVLPRSHSREYRHMETATSMPAFAPTAFLF